MIRHQENVNLSCRHEGVGVTALAGLFQRMASPAPAKAVTPTPAPTNLAGPGLLSENRSDRESWTPIHHRALSFGLLVVSREAFLRFQVTEPHLASGFVIDDRVECLAVLEGNLHSNRVRVFATGPLHRQLFD